MKLDIYNNYQDYCKWCAENEEEPLIPHEWAQQDREDLR